MFKLYSQKAGTTNNGAVSEYICDTDADFEDLPEANSGSMALSCETGNMKIVNASGVWVDFAKAEA